MSKLRKLHLILEFRTLVRISYGGGMGGASNRWWVMAGETPRVDGTVVTFTGYKVDDFDPGDHRFYYLDEESHDILVFDCSYWPEHRMTNLQACLLRGNMELAMSEYQAADNGKKPVILQPTLVTACGGWYIRETL